MVRITEELLRKSAEHNEGLISTLEEVALHQRDIEKIEYIGNWCRDLKILDLTSNLIPKIENLQKLKKLEYLKLGLNNIERIENLEGCESLKKLDLTVNFIGELTSIESLKGLEHLQEIYLVGNPCTEFEGYREFVVATLPKLKFLDGHEILKSERLRALQEIHETRSGVIQQQKKYFVRRQTEREEVQLQEVSGDDEKAEVKRMPDDEEAEEKSFWEEKVSYTPESRLRVHEHMQKTKDKKDNSGKHSKEKKERKLVADDGRILNINEAKFDFTLTEDDDQQALILDIAIYKYMDTSLIDIDINPTYVRGVIRGKIFQLALPEEVQSMSSKAQRVTTNGHLVLTMPKVKQIIRPVCVPKSKPSSSPHHTTENSSSSKRTETLEVDPSAHRMVDFTNIVTENEKSAHARAPLGSNQPWWARKFEEKAPSADFVDDPDVPPLM